MNNTLSAITTIVRNIASTTELQAHDGVDNRMNQMGDALEDFIKNAFADCIGQNQRTINQKRSNVFSYLGNSNNPPDAMLRNGDAIEIKKIKTLGTSQLQLNSSYPKNKLHHDCSKINSECRDREDWNQKDMLYVVGQVEGTHLKTLSMVYGDVYCDDKAVYERVENAIRDGLNSLEAVEMAETDELGRINKVDHLEISDLRVRGMWLIKTPFKVFGYLTEDISDYIFKLVALIPTDKFESFDNKYEFEEECDELGITISDEELPDPQNPAELIETKLITYYI